MVQPQAMACGTPVIATYNAGAEDLFTDGVEGFIVPPRNPEAIRERIQFLLDNPQELARMRQAALARVSALGGWDAFGERTLAAYRQLAALREERQSVAAN